QLAYPIQKVFKAHYVLMNIEVVNETLNELEHAFKFNDAVIRHLTVKMDEAVTGPSPMMKEEKSRNVTEAPSAEAKDQPAPPAAAEGDTHMPPPRGRGKGKGGKFAKGKDARQQNRGLFRRRKFCRFTAEKVKQVDYKDIAILKDFINENGK